MAKPQTVSNDLGLAPGRPSPFDQSSAWQMGLLGRSWLLPLPVPPNKRFSQIPLFSACITASWSKLLLCLLLLLPIVLVLHFPCLCSAFSARLKILEKSRKALPSAGCVLQGQIGGRNRKKAKLLKSSLMERLVGRKCHLAQGRQHFRVWCCLGEHDVSVNAD